MTQTAKLALEDGTVFTGDVLRRRRRGRRRGLLQHLDDRLSGDPHRPQLSRPDRHDDLPEIGNYGVNAEDVESRQPAPGRLRRPRASAGWPSNFRSEDSLDAYLKRHGIVGIDGIDTRALVRRLRNRGAMKGILSTVDLDDASLVAKAKASPGLVGRDLVREVMPGAAAPMERTAAATGRSCPPTAQIRVAADARRTSSRSTSA